MPHRLLTCAEYDQFIYNLSERGLVRIFSDRGLLQYYGEEYENKFYPYKDSNALQRLYTSSPEPESLLRVEILPGYVLNRMPHLQRIARHSVLMFDGCDVNAHLNRSHAEIQMLILKYGLREEKLRTMSFNGFTKNCANTAGCVSALVHNHMHMHLLVAIFNDC